MQLIGRWLRGKRNFYVGRILYEYFGRDKQLKSLFAKGNTTFAAGKLAQALQEIYDCGKCTRAKPVTIIYDEMPKGADAVLQAIHEEWSPKYQLMKYRQHQLDAFGDDNSAATREKCKELCREILELEQECIMIWKKRDYYEDNGHLPELSEDEEPFVIPEDPIVLARTIETIKKNIRRNKRKAGETGKPIYTALVKKYENQLLLINEKLCK